jgi:mannose-1-phosphate guanylyltransferase
MRYAMIMAGGAGTRLWPMSRTGRPKQLIPFIELPAVAPHAPPPPGDPHQPSGNRPPPPPRSLLEISAARLEGIIPADRRYICTAEAYRAAIQETLPEFSGDRILGEPAGRDTVNAVGFAAAIFQKLDPDATFAVFTADHIIEPVDRFKAMIEIGFRMVEADPSRLVTFSIKPTYPATGFGYVERGMPLDDVEGARGLAFKVARYVEKPDLPRATAYVQSGAFGWNSGMFVWKAATFMEALRRYKPESHEGLLKIQDAWGTPRQAEVLREVYPTLPRISVDYAVMEPAAKDRDRPFTVCTVTMDVQWLDVGSWPSYAETLSADAQGNRIAPAAHALHATPAVTVNSSGNLVVNPVEGHTVALLGCKDLIVVHTKEATLVMPRERAEELKLLHQQLPEELK